MSTINNSIMLDVHKLNKRFGDVHAVKDLSFQVKKGEVFGFLGPNGAGKTTTMRMVTCFIPASSGTFKVEGLDASEHSLDIRKRIGYLAETNPLYNDMMVDEYLTFVGKLHDMHGQKLNSAKDQMYQTCGLTKMRQRQIGKLSKGYRQRVGLAQALINNPDLLILDEPMSGLDPNQIIDIRQLIKNIGKEKTVIYCSHILSEVSATCNRILIINDGVVVATGTPAELTAKSGKQNLYSLKIKGDKNSVESAIGSINDVKQVHATALQDDWLQVKVTGQGDHDIGEELFRCVVDHKWSLSELKREEKSLEEIFTQLTRG